MKDERVASFRNALHALIESLEASIRIARWEGDEAVPQPLKESASQLVTRLGAAERYASATYNGNVADTKRVNAICGAMRRLDVAYVAYRKRMHTERDRRDAASLLDAELEDVKAGAESWS